MKKRLLSLLLALALVAGVLPGAVWAETEPPTDAADGASADAAVDTGVSPADETTVYNTSITVPDGAEVFVGQKSKHFVPFTEVEPAAVNTDESAGTEEYRFNLANGTYNYRVSGPDYVTCAGTFKKAAADYTLTLTEADLEPDGKTKTSVDRDLTANSGFNVADIYLNINSQNYLKLNGVGSSYQLVNLRNWEAVDTTTSNYFIEPDYHYTVINEDGTESDGNVVTVSDSGLVKAESDGTAIVLVTYDAMTLSFNGGSEQFYGAIWPENTGVFVVSVGAGESGITTGMTINEGKNTTDSKLSGDALDAEHDVIYFTGDKGSYTFTPGTERCTVSAANPTVCDAMSFTGFEEVKANADGSFTVPLTEGRNIVRLEKNGKAEYQVITAKPVTITVNDGVPVKPGDKLSVKFEGVYHPANKLAGVYNMSACIRYAGADTDVGDKVIGAPGNQYKFASTDTAHVMSSTLTRSATTWLVTYRKTNTDTELTVPADYSKDTFTFSGGAFMAYGFGDPYGNHRGITLENGKDANFNAAIREAWLGQLPDIEIPIVATEAALEKIDITTPPTKTTYFAGDAFDPAGMVVTAAYADGKTQEITKYTVSPEALNADTTAVTVTYNGKTASVPVTVQALELTGIAVTTPPAKTSYTAGEMFKTTGMVVTGTYNNGSTGVLVDYTYEPKGALKAGVNKITLTCQGQTAELAISVSEASEPGPNEPSTITVKFTLLGDSNHGAPAGEEDTHTRKKNNLETWIAQTEVTVSRGAVVLDVIENALGEAGIPYENTSGNYISSVRGLGEFSNGPMSGWQYTLNGRYPDLGVSEQTVKNGDRIVFHYTDDYTQEEWSSSSGGNGGGGGAGITADKKDEASAATELKPEATANANGEAAASVTGEDLSGTIAQAKTDKADIIVIAPEVKGEADKISVELPKSGVDDIAGQTGAALKVETGIADITIPRRSLNDLAGQSGSKVTVSAEAVKTGGGVKLEVAVDGKAVEKLDGGIAVAIPAQAGAGSVLVLVKADGTEEVVRKSVVDGKTVSAILDGSATVKLVDNSRSFADTETHWAKEAVAFASSHELFNGTAEDTFAPDTPMSRAMLATVLYRLEDAAASGGSPFADVAEGAWYTDAVVWASAENIVTGADGGFAPDRDITRQELVTMLYRYANSVGLDTGKTAKLDGYTDSGEVADWAGEAMSWAVANGLVSGRTSTTLAPAGTATRAEVAAVMQRLVALMVK